MKNNAFFLSVCFILIAAVNVFGAQTYTVQRPVSAVNFTIRHVGVALVRGQFKKFHGDFVFSDGGLTQFSGTVETASLNTGIAARDEFLRSKSFFDTQGFPHMVIVSEKILQSGNDIVMQSRMTIRGVSKKVKLQGKIRFLDADKKTLQATFSGVINRKDFGLRLNKLSEFFVSEVVKVSLTLQAL